MSSFVDETTLDALEAAEVDEEQHEPQPEHDEPSVELVPHEPETLTPEPIDPATLDMVPPELEMRGLVQLAVTLSAAELVPKALRNKPNDVLLVLLTARDLGIKLTTALRLCYPIEGQVTVAPKLKLAIIRERKLGRIWPDADNDDTRATWYAVRADDPDTTFASTYTIEQATSAKLVGKDNWKHYPARMLSWRALGYLMDDAFGEVGAGLYSPDELGAVTDEDGQPILDVMEVGPHDGMAAPRGRRSSTPTAEEPADDPTKALIARMMRALPDAGREAGVELWPNAVSVKIADLTVKRAKAARALCDSLWKRAEGGEWGPWDRPFDPDEPQAPESAQSESVHDEPHESVESDTERSSGQSGDAEPTPSDTIDSIIDSVQAMTPDTVLRELDRLDEEPPSGADEAELRRTLALRLGRDAGLL